MLYISQGKLENALVAGAVDGSIVAYDTARMTILWRKATAEGSITCLTTIWDQDTLVAMTKLGTAIVLDMNTGRELAKWSSSLKFDIHHMSSLSDARLLLAGNSITMVDSTTGAKLGKWTGHATPVIDVASIPTCPYFCSAATGDRTIAIWSTRVSPTGKILHKSAFSQISLDSPVAQVCMAAVSDGLFYIIAVTLSGDMHVCRCIAQEAEDGQNKEQSIKISEWAASNQGGAPIVQVAVESVEATAIQVILASGSAIKPIFTRMKLQGQSDGSVTKFSKPRDDDTGMLLNPLDGRGGNRDTRQQRTTNTSVSKTGASEPVLLHGRTSAQSKALDLPMNGPDHDMHLAEDEEEDERELTFAERIAALKGEHLVLVQEGPLQQRGEAATPKADSLSVLLSQAITNEDKSLLERCLAVKNPSIVSKTVRHLSPGDASTLMNLLVRRLHAAPRRGEQLSGWIRFTLIHHAGYFAGSGACTETLASLYQIIDSRLASYQSLIALHGRLDLIVNTVRYASNFEEEIVQKGALLTAEINDDGDIEVQDAAAALALESDDEEEYLEGESGGNSFDNMED